MSITYSYKINMAGPAKGMRKAFRVIEKAIAANPDNDGKEIDKICERLTIVSKAFPKMRIFVNVQHVDEWVSILFLIKNGNFDILLKSGEAPLCLEESLALVELHQSKDAGSLAGIVGTMIQTCKGGNDHMAPRLNVMAKEVILVIKKNPALATDPKTLELLQTLYPMMENICGPADDEGRSFESAEGLEAAIGAAALSLSTKKAFKTVGKGQGRKCEPVSAVSV
jgi:hypothetical protein